MKPLGKQSLVIHLSVIGLPLLAFAGWTPLKLTSAPPAAVAEDTELRSSQRDEPAPHHSGSTVTRADCNQNGLDDATELDCGFAFSAESNIAPPGLTIPDFDFDGVSHTIYVSEAVNICRLRLHLHIVHPKVGQLIAKLWHDDGINPPTEIAVIDLIGNPTPHNSSGECGAGLEVLLSDEASTSIEMTTHGTCNDSIVFTGTYSPYPGLLSAFSGHTSTGDWTITVYDVKPGPDGSRYVASWSLDFYESGDNDCNINQVPDECDITAGTSLDVNHNGIPDECEGPQIRPGDLSCDGSISFADIDPFVTCLSSGNCACP